MLILWLDLKKAANSASLLMQIIDRVSLRLRNI